VPVPNPRWSEEEKQWGNIIPAAVCPKGPAKFRTARKFCAAVVVTPAWGGRKYADDDDDELLPVLPTPLYSPATEI
jgi:hypothetical protein